MRRSWRTATVVLLAGGLLSIGLPALALSSAPDTTWRTNGKTYALVRLGSTVFVGGTFSKAISPNGNQILVSNIAAFDITTGSYISSFAASVNGTSASAQVGALAVSADGSKLYIGGRFDTVDGQPRQNFAAVDTATGALDPSVTISPNKPVNAILATASLVYLGGNFLKVDSLARLHLAAISAADGTLSTTWTPTSQAGTDPCPSLLPPGTNCGPVSDGGSGNIHVLALAPDGNSLFVGGNFYYVNGVPRNCVARVSLTDGSLLNWQVPWDSIPSEGPSDPYQGPNASWDILPTTSQVFVSWGRTPNGFSSFSMSTDSTGLATKQWSNSTPGNAESLALSPDGTRLFVGGHFGTAVLDYRISSCNVWVHGLLSVSPTTGAVLCDWFPAIAPFGGQSAPGSGATPNYVGGWDLLRTENALFVAGWMTSISGVQQSGFARFTLVGSPPPPPAPPTITSFSPTQGPVGTPFTISGTGFSGATSVRVGTFEATFTVDSDTQIRTSVPSGISTGGKPLYVITPNGKAKSTTNFLVTA